MIIKKYKQSETYKDKQSTYYKQWRLDNPDKAAHYQLMNYYGITLDEYNTILEAQNYKCKICGKTAEEVASGKPIKRLAVDHCHETGEIRGILCANCNTGIGLLCHDPGILKNALRYLGVHIP